MGQGYIDQIKEEGKKLSESFKNNSNLTAEEIEGMNRMYVDRMNKLADKQEYDTNESIGNIEKANKQAEKDYADQILAYKNDALRAQQEGQAQIEASKKAARWTGAAELAASLVNLFGVGSLNASNQQYKSYSQDWMQKADRDMREHRARMENLRDRQRQQQDRLTALRLGNAQALEQMRQKAAADVAARRANIEGAALSGAEKATQTRAQGADKAAQAEYATAKDAANIGLHERQIAQSAWQHQQSINLHAATQGLKPDGKGGFDVDENSSIYKNAVANGKIKSGSKSSGSGSGNWYNVTIGGKPYALNMNKETREQAIRDGKEEMKKDVLKMAGLDDWNELVAGTTGRNGKYKEYADIVHALDGVNPDEDNKTISDFYDKHRSQCDNMGMHLYNVATGVREGYSTNVDYSGGSNSSTTVNPYLEFIKQGG